jgi:uncharacterized protein YkwD
MSPRAGKIALTLISVAAVAYSLAGAAWKDADYGKYDYKTFEASKIANSRIDMKNIDYGLLNAAIFFETNRQRDLQERELLKHLPALEKVAAGYSAMMVERRFLSHVSPDEKTRLVEDRIAAGGIRLGNNLRGENISDMFGIEYQAGRPVCPPEANRGYFSYEPGGEPIKAHTYLGLAKLAVDEWMRSPGHRKNILQKGFKYLGVGSAHYKDAKFYNIDRFKFTQDFVGEVRQAPAGQ